MCNEKIFCIYKNIVKRNNFNFDQGFQNLNVSKTEIMVKYF